MRGSLPCIRRQQIINEFCYFLFFFKGLRGCAAELSIKAEAGHFLTYTHLEVNKKAFHTKWSLPSENSCSTSSHYAAATETDHIKETALLKVGGWGRGLCTVLRIQYGTNHRGLFSLVFLRHDLICSREPCCYSLSNPSHVWLFRHRVCRKLQKGFFFFFINILKVQGHSPSFACSWPLGSCGENKRQRRQTSPRTATEQTF